MPTTWMDAALCQTRRFGSFPYPHQADPDRLSVAELRELAEPAGFVFRDTTGSIWYDIARFTRET